MYCIYNNYHKDTYGNPGQYRAPYPLSMMGRTLDYTYYDYVFSRVRLTPSLGEDSPLYFM